MNILRVIAAWIPALPKMERAGQVENCFLNAARYPVSKMLDGFVNFYQSLCHG
jgi:hypothetical protein